MLIWGTKSVKRTIGTGEFYCPHCQVPRAYNHVRARRHGHLYRLPLIPMGEGVEFVECRGCRNTWQPSVLQQMPQNQDTTKGLFGVTILATSVAVAAADRNVDERQIDIICAAMERVTGNRADQAAITKLVAQADAAQLATAENLLQRIEPALHAEGKELIIEVGLAVAFATGPMEDSQAAVLSLIATALGVSSAHMKGIVAGLSEKSAG